MNVLEIAFTGDVNFDLLVEQLKQVSSKVEGVAYQVLNDGKGILAVVLYEPFSDLEQQRVQEVIDKHDPSAQTAHQQTETAHRVRREQFRRDPLKLDTVGVALPEVQQLVERVAWLEAEVLRLVGGQRDVQ